MGGFMSNYWVVGAMWENGSVDQMEVFIRRGYWILGWNDADQPAQAKLRDQIKPGDRIAIKRMLGHGSSNIEIRAIGVVSEVDPDDKRVYVHWLVKDLSRLLPSRGFYKSIHGPLKQSEAWVRQAFCV
jgi:hypothetical protein